MVSLSSEFYKCPKNPKNPLKKTLNFFRSLRPRDFGGGDAVSGPRASGDRKGKSGTMDAMSTTMEYYDNYGILRQL